MNWKTNPNIAALRPYTPGKPIEELAREYGLNEADIVKLASNENPLGMSAKALSKMQKTAQSANFYPDGNSFELKKCLAEFYAVKSEQLVLGNGSNDVLDLIARTFLAPDKEAIFSEYAFAVYPIVTQLQNATAVITPANDWGHDLDAMLAAITGSTSVIFVANPNNPTGTMFGKTELEAFLAKVPERIIVVLDEAYSEYLVSNEQYPQGVSYLSQYTNLIVTRTFSKIYGLAGLRIGYGICSPEIAELLNRARQPFNVNLVAQEAAIESLNDNDFVKQAIAINTSGLRQLEAAFDEMRITYIPSKANFITFEITNAAEINEKLMQQGVIVRPLAGYKMPNHLRVSVGSAEQNQRFIDVLKGILV